MPAKHGYQDWDAGRIRAWAGRVGPNCAAVVERVFQSVRFEEQGYDACLAVVCGSVKVDTSADLIRA